MGWTYSFIYGTTDRLELCRNQFGSQPSWATIIKDAIVDDVYYAAMKDTETGTIWGLVVLTDIYNGEFGYKDMSEDMLPYYFDCPKEIIKLLSPTNNEYANQWRQRCLQNVAT